MEIIADDLEVQGTVQAGTTTKAAFHIKENNIGGVQGKSPFGNTENIAYFDNVDTLSWGPTQDNAHRIQQVFYGPVNYVKRHIFEDFNENLGGSFPPTLSSSPIFSGATVSYHRPSRIKFVTSAAQQASGIFVAMQNMSLGIDAETQLHFCLNTDSRRNIDLQFGLREAVNGVNQLRFRYASTTGADGYLVATCVNGANSHTTDSFFYKIDDRRLFCLRIRKNGDILFCAGNDNNELITIATYHKSSNYVPTNTQELIPFLQFRTNDAAAAKTLFWDSMYLITEW